MELKLVLPTKKYFNQIEAYKKEMIENNSSMDGCGSLRNDSIKEWLKKSKDHKQGKNLPSGYVRATQYICIRKSDDKLIGMLQIRHELNDYLFNYGGHIGDSILPSQRNKGYGKKILSLGIEKCKKMGIDRVLILCKETNIASRKCILANGGVFENYSINDDGIKLERYWVE